MIRLSVGSQKMAAMLVGDEFVDFFSFEQKLKLIQETTNSVFVIDECQTVDSANRLIKNGKIRMATSLNTATSNTHVNTMALHGQQ